MKSVHVLWLTAALAGVACAGQREAVELGDDWWVCPAVGTGSTLSSTAWGLKDAMIVGTIEAQDRRVPGVQVMLTPAATDGGAEAIVGLSNEAGMFLLQNVTPGLHHFHAVMVGYNGLEVAVEISAHAPFDTIRVTLGCSTS